MFQNTFFKQDYFNNKLYWHRYLQTDVRISKNFCNIRPNHYFNDIPFSRWPFFISLAGFFVFFFFGLSLKKFDLALPLFAVSMALLAYYVYGWAYDMILESLVFGRYNRKVRASLLYGFFLFLISEITVFGCFFWAYFDRLFDPTVFAGDCSLPLGMEPLFKTAKPIYATLVLVISGTFANLGLYYIRYGYYDHASATAGFSFVVGTLFLGIQFAEYSHLLFTMGDSVFASSFYLLTGFHGLHVIIGLILLGIASDRVDAYHFSKQRSLGYTIALIYWHFVDYVWIFLFYSVYIVNWNYTYYYMW